MTMYLEQYIADSRRALVEGNQADNKGTPASELEEDRSRCEKYYAAGLEVCASIGEEDLRRCMGMYNVQNAYGAHSLCEGKLLGRRVIAFQYVFKLDEMRKMRAVLL